MAQAQNFANFFNEGMKEMMNPDNFSRYCNTLDLGKMSETMKKSNEAMYEASHIALESVQSMVKRSTEMLQDNARDIFNGIKDVASANTPEQAVGRHQRLAQEIFCGAVANTKEMLDMVSKATMEVFEKMSKQASEGLACPVTPAKAAKKS